MNHFLRPLLDVGQQQCSLVSGRTGSIVAVELEAAIDSKSRRRGLLGRTGLPEHHALVLAPCSAVHTFFMRFAIDVAFVGRDGRVLKTVEQLRAWRIAGAVGAFATVEMPAGTIHRSGLAKGDRVFVRRTDLRETSSPS